MDLSKYSVEDILLSALKSEIEAKALYLKIAEQVKNAILKDRLQFIAAEEERHKVFIEGLYKKEFPNKEIVLPDKTPVPLPEVKMEDEDVRLTEVFEGVMEAEKSAADFYTSLADLMEKDAEVKNTLLYFASMELGHYRLFQLEREALEKYEDYDDEWPMMHVGP
jgi:rubrerythrin